MISNLNRSRTLANRKKEMISFTLLLTHPIIDTIQQSTALARKPHTRICAWRTHSRGRADFDQNLAKTNDCRVCFPFRVLFHALINRNYRFLAYLVQALELLGGVHRFLAPCALFTHRGMHLMTSINLLDTRSAAKYVKTN